MNKIDVFKFTFDADKLWFISDIHFGHKNIIKYANRPFSSVEEMNETIVKNWNMRVGDKDIVFNLGDLSFFPKDGANLVRRLNGKKYWILGNHDRDISQLKPFFGWIGNYAELKVKDEDTDSGIRFIVLSHYPFASWKLSHKGSWHFHGHCHGELFHENYPRVDVGVDGQKGSHDPTYGPISYQEIKTIITKRKLKKNLHHADKPI